MLLKHRAIAEQETGREMYERVGLVAHALGLARHDNPYARAACSSYIKMQTLASSGDWVSLAGRRWDSWADQGPE